MLKDTKHEQKKGAITKTAKSSKTDRKQKVATDLEGNVITNVNVNKKDKKIDFKKHFYKYKKLYTVVVLIPIIILSIIGVYIGIRNFILNKKYSKYEKQMDLYGFSLMYTNESPESSEKLTRIDMVKIILASIYNTTEVESIGFGAKGDFEGDEWSRTAEAFGVIKKGYITKETYNKGVTYKEALVTYLNARSKLKDIPVSSKKESNFKNLQSFSQEERKYINDAVENGLLKNSSKRLKIDNNLFKGQFNELVIKFVEKYATFVPEGETLVTKKESKPINYEMYPYILYSVDKEAYEYKGVSEGEGDYATPAKTYKYKKDSYEQMQYRTELYYNEILNVDYRTVKKDELYEKINKYLRHDYENEISSYVDYVKENQIVLEGTAKVQLPIFYMDGIRYRARVKLTFEIKNSKTDKNILLGDLIRGLDVKYNNKSYTVYIDAPMGTTLLSRALYLDMEPIIDIVVSNKETTSPNEF